MKVQFNNVAEPRVRNVFNKRYNRSNLGLLQVSNLIWNYSNAYTNLVGSLRQLPCGEKSYHENERRFIRV